MNITEAELLSLNRTKSEEEWNNVCDEIKQARDGAYPPDWWPVVMQSGLAREIMADWTKSDTPDLKIYYVDGYPEEK
jgi:hypothetical protein